MNRQHRSQQQRDKRILSIEKDLADKTQILILDHVESQWEKIFNENKMQWEITEAELKATVSIKDEKINNLTSQQQCDRKKILEQKDKIIQLEKQNLYQKKIIILLISFIFLMSIMITINLTISYFHSPNFIKNISSISPTSLDFEANKNYNYNYLNQTLLRWRALKSFNQTPF